jgi:hypothetical protein
MIDGNCDGCFYAVPTISDTAEPMVKCKRYPPVQLVLVDGEVVQSFPDAGERCGEYKNVDEPVFKPIATKDSVLCACGHYDYWHHNGHGKCGFWPNQACECSQFQSTVLNRDEG